MKKVFLMITALVCSVLVFAPSTSAGDKMPTYNRDIVRITQNNCQACHRPGNIAPFSLMTYGQVAAWGERIMQVTQAGIMPPWKPVDGCGQFRGTRRLSDEEIDTFARWIAAGRPEGDPRDLPPPREFPDQWSLGEPDMALQPERAYTPPVGNDEYRCFPLDPGFDEDLWLSGVDIQPGNRTIDHHVVLFLDANRQSLELVEGEPGNGYRCFGGPGFFSADGLSIVGTWTPGSQPQFLPEGVGIKIPADALIVMQVHYHTAGHHGANQTAEARNGESDLTKVGLYFSKETVRKQMRFLPILNARFVIPAGDPYYEVTAQSQVSSRIGNIHVLTMLPHMHLLGKEMKVEAIQPGGKPECLIYINDWDFNWQDNYSYAKPVALPVGTTISITSYFDNSEDNPRQPSHPPRPVRFGEQTTDEMCVALVGYTRDDEDLSRTK